MTKLAASFEFAEYTLWRACHPPPPPPPGQPRAVDRRATYVADRTLITASVTAAGRCSGLAYGHRRILN